VVELEFSTIEKSSSEEQNPNEANEFSTSKLAVLFATPDLANQFLSTLSLDQRIYNSLMNIAAVESEVAVQKMVNVEDGFKYLRLLHHQPSIEVFVNACRYLTSLGMLKTKLKVDSAICLSEFLVYKEGLTLTAGSIPVEISKIEEDLRQSYSRIQSAEDSHIHQSTLDSSELPLSGMVVMSVAFRDVAVHSATPAAWMPCWIRIDQISRSIVFFEHGPAQPPSFILSVQRASLCLPDLSDPHEQLKLSITNGEVSDRHMTKLMSVSILFRTLDELWRWTMTFCSITGDLVTQSGDRTNSISLAPANALMKPHLLSFLTCLKSTSNEMLSAIESTFSEREIANELIRHRILPGLSLKAIKFQIVNQHVVVQQSKSCVGCDNSIPEGATLLSINGLSAIHLPAKSILKFIAEMPKQMEADITFIKCPRQEVILNGIVIDDACQAKTSSYVSLETANQESSESAASAFGGKKLNAESTNNLQKMIVRRRSLFAAGDVPNFMESNTLTSEQISTPINQTTVSQNVEVLKTSVSMERIYKESLQTLPWEKQRLILNNGKITVFPLSANTCDESNSTYQFSLGSTQLKIIHNSDVKSLSDLCLELIDDKNHLLFHCSSFKMLQSIYRRLVIALKLHGSIPVDLTSMAHQGERWKVHNANRRQSIISNNFQSMMATSVQPQAFASSGILSQLRTMEITNTSFEEKSTDNGDLGYSTVPMTTDELLMKDADQSNCNLLQAAELLEQSLNALELPSLFPSATVVETQTRELRTLNKTNHALVGELLSLLV
jgi:hypothetical protein